MNVFESAVYLEELLSFSEKDKSYENTKLLLENYGQLSYIIQLDAYTLIKTSKCSETSADLIRLVAGLTSRRITDKYKIGKKYLQNEIKEFVCGLLFGATVETIYMLLFDESDRLIGCEYIGEGTVNSSGVLPRKLIDIALRKNARYVILAHNHPCGKAHPSGDDLSVTSLLLTSFNNARIILRAHYVVAGFDVADCVTTVSDLDSEN